MKRLFLTFDEKKKCYVPLEIMGVKVPTPPGRGQFDKYLKEFQRVYGFRRIDEGIGVSIDYVHQVRTALEQGYKAKCFDKVDGVNGLANIVGEGDRKIEIVLTFDGFRLHNKAKLIAFAWKFSNAKNTPSHSPMIGNHFMLLQQNKECAELIRASLGQELDAVNKLINTGCIENVTIDG